jgi:hypothetical protein
MYGCDRWLYAYGRDANIFPDGRVGNNKRDMSNCNNPKALGWLAATYVISFIILGSQVLMTLFVGVNPQIIFYSLRLTCYFPRC